jgi:hypothetical protein
MAQQIVTLVVLTAAVNFVYIHPTNISYITDDVTLIYMTFLYGSCTLRPASFHSIASPCFSAHSHGMYYGIDLFVISYPMMGDKMFKFYYTSLLSDACTWTFNVQASNDSIKTNEYTHAQRCRHMDVSAPFCSSW